jgi:hypothetical protein
MAGKLGQYLVDEGLLTPDQLQAGLEAQRIRGGSLGTNLLAAGSLDESALGRALAAVYGVPPVSRGELLAAPRDVVGLLSADYARRHRALPFRTDGEQLALALQNPNDSLAVHEAAFLTGFVIQPHVAPEVVIRAALAHHHQLPDLPWAGLAPSRPAAADATPADAGNPAPAPARADQDARPAPVARASQARGSRDAPAAAATPPAPPAPTTTPAGLAERLAGASGRDDVVSTVLDELAAWLPRAAAFAIRGSEALLLSARGIVVPEGRTVAVPTGEPTVLSPALEGRIAYGAVTTTPGNLDFYTLLGGVAPKAALVVPVTLRSRPVLVLYADDPRGTAPPPDMERVRRLSPLTACALEIALLRVKMMRL